MAVNLRLATPQDSRALARVHVDCWRSTYSGLLPAQVISAHTVSTRLALWESTLSGQRDCRVWLAEVDNEVVGFVAGGEATRRGEEGRQQPPCQQGGGFLTWALRCCHPPAIQGDADI